MSEIQLPAGKFVPPIQPNPDITRVVQRTPSAPANGTFSNELQSRLQSVPQPSAQAPQIQAIPVPKTLPAHVATGQQFENTIINNWQQYQTMNVHQASPSTPMPISATAQPVMQSAMYNAQAAADPVQAQPPVYQPYNVAPTAQSTQAMNSVFARNDNQADSIASEPIAEQPVHVPAPEIVLSPQEAAQLDAIIAGQQTQQTNAASKITKFDPQNQQNNAAQQSNDSEKKKGFFKSAGSFFKNIASGLTLGFYRPDNEPSPQGIARVAEPFKKILWDAPKSLLFDAPVGAYHSVKDSLGENDSSKQTTIAASQNAQQVIDAGEKIIASRRGKAHTGFGSKPQSNWMS